MKRISEAARRGLETYRRRKEMEGWAGDWADPNDPPWSSTSYFTPAQTRPKDPIDEATDDRLILELIKRGYCVAKMSPDEMVEASK